MSSPPDDTRNFNWDNHPAVFIQTLNTPIHDVNVGAPDGPMRDGYLLYVLSKNRNGSLRQTYVNDYMAEWVNGILYDGSGMLTLCLKDNTSKPVVPSSTKWVGPAPNGAHVFAPWNIQLGQSCRYADNELAEDRVALSEFTTTMQQSLTPESSYHVSDDIQNLKTVMKQWYMISDRENDAMATAQNRAQQARIMANQVLSEYVGDQPSRQQQQSGPAFGRQLVQSDPYMRAIEARAATLGGQAVASALADEERNVTADLAVLWNRYEGTTPRYWEAVSAYLGAMIRQYATEIDTIDGMLRTVSIQQNESQMVSLLVRKEVLQKLIVYLQDMAYRPGTYSPYITAEIGRSVGNETMTRPEKAAITSSAMPPVEQLDRDDDEDERPQRPPPAVAAVGSRAVVPVAVAAPPLLPEAALARIELLKVSEIELQNGLRYISGLVADNEAQIADVQLQIETLARNAMVPAELSGTRMSAHAKAAQTLDRELDRLTKEATYERIRQGEIVDLLLRTRAEIQRLQGELAAQGALPAMSSSTSLSRAAQERVRRETREGLNAEVDAATAAQNAWLDQVDAYRERQLEPWRLAAARDDMSRAEIIDSANRAAKAAIEMQKVAALAKRRDEEEKQRRRLETQRVESQATVQQMARVLAPVVQPDALLQLQLPVDTTSRSTPASTANPRAQQPRPSQVWSMVGDLALQATTAEKMQDAAQQVVDAEKQLLILDKKTEQTGKKLTEAQKQARKAKEAVKQEETANAEEITRDFGNMPSLKTDGILSGVLNWPLIKWFKDIFYKIVNYKLSARFKAVVMGMLKSAIRIVPDAAIWIWNSALIPLFGLDPGLKVKETPVVLRNIANIIADENLKNQHYSDDDEEEEEEEEEEDEETKKKKKAWNTFVEKGQVTRRIQPAPATTRNLNPFAPREERGGFLGSQRGGGTWGGGFLGPAFAQPRSLQVRRGKVRRGRQTGRNSDTDERNYDVFRGVGRDVERFRQEGTGWRSSVVDEPILQSDPLAAWERKTAAPATRPLAILPRSVTRRVATPPRRAASRTPPRLREESIDKDSGDDDEPGEASGRSSGQLIGLVRHCKIIPRSATLGDAAGSYFDDTDKIVMTWTTDQLVLGAVFDVNQPDLLYMGYIGVNGPEALHPDAAQQMNFIYKGNDGDGFRQLWWKWKEQDNTHYRQAYMLPMRSNKDISQTFGNEPWPVRLSNIPEYVEPLDNLVQIPAYISVSDLTRAAQQMIQRNPRALAMGTSSGQSKALGACCGKCKATSLGGACGTCGKAPTCGMERLDKLRILGRASNDVPAGPSSYYRSWWETNPGMTALNILRDYDARRVARPPPGTFNARPFEAYVPPGRRLTVAQEAAARRQARQQLEYEAANPNPSMTASERRWLNQQLEQQDSAAAAAAADERRRVLNAQQAEAELASRATADGQEMRGIRTVNIPAQRGVVEEAARAARRRAHLAEMQSMSEDMAQRAAAIERRPPAPIDLPRPLEPMRRMPPMERIDQPPMWSETTNTTMPARLFSHRRAMKRLRQLDDEAAAQREADIQRQMDLQQLERQEWQTQLGEETGFAPSDVIDAVRNQLPQEAQRAQQRAELEQELQRQRIRRQPMIPNDGDDDDTANAEEDRQYLLERDARDAAIQQEQEALQARRMEQQRLAARQGQRRREFQQQQDEEYAQRRVEEQRFEQRQAAMGQRMDQQMAERRRGALGPNTNEPTYDDPDSVDAKMRAYLRANAERMQEADRQDAKMLTRPSVPDRPSVGARPAVSVGPAATTYNDGESEMEGEDPRSAGLDWDSPGDMRGPQSAVAQPAMGAYEPDYSAITSADAARREAERAARLAAMPESTTFAWDKPLVRASTAYRKLAQDFHTVTGMPTRATVNIADAGDLANAADFGRMAKLALFAGTLPEEAALWAAQNLAGYTAYEAAKKPIDEAIDYVVNSKTGKDITSALDDTGEGLEDAARWVDNIPVIGSTLHKIGSGIGTAVKVVAHGVGKALDAINKPFSDAAKEIVNIGRQVFGDIKTTHIYLPSGMTTNMTKKQLLELALAVDSFAPAAMAAPIVMKDSQGRVVFAGTQEQLNAARLAQKIARARWRNSILTNQFQDQLDRDSDSVARARWHNKIATTQFQDQLNAASAATAAAQAAQAATAQNNQTAQQQIVARYAHNTGLTPATAEQAYNVAVAKAKLGKASGKYKKHDGKKPKPDKKDKGKQVTGSASSEPKTRKSTTKKAVKGKKKSVDKICSSGVSRKASKRK
jgi:hypothetical protein